MTQRNWTCAETQVTYCAQCIEPSHSINRNGCGLGLGCECCDANREEVDPPSFFDGDSPLPEDSDYPYGWGYPYNDEA